MLTAIGAMLPNNLQDLAEQCLKVSQEITGVSVTKMLVKTVFYATTVQEKIYELSFP